MSSDPLQTNWEQLPDDPDLEADLGYLLLELDIISTAIDRDKVIILPKDESLLKDDAFVVTRRRDLYDLAEWT